jgi:hypothetical protein
VAHRNYFKHAVAKAVQMELVALRISTITTTASLSECASNISVKNIFKSVLCHTIKLKGNDYYFLRKVGVETLLRSLLDVE